MARVTNRMWRHGVVRGGVLVLVLLLEGCAQIPAGSPAGGCVGGTVVPYGLVEVRDDALLGQAVQAAGKGGLCEGKVLRVQHALTVYRVWDKSRRTTEYGRWWSFTPPAGPAAAYRADNAICPEWSTLDVVTQCRLKVGSEIVVGPGQSAVCAEGVFYPASSVNQVFVPNDTRDPARLTLGVDACSDSVAWP